MKERIEQLLVIYRERLEKAAQVRDFTLAVRTEAQIGMLEMLLIYAEEYELKEDK